jgi:hypothetical protein
MHGNPEILITRQCGFKRITQRLDCRKSISKLYSLAKLRVYYVLTVSIGCI